MISQSERNINENFFVFDLTTEINYGNILWQNPIALLAQLDRVSGYGPEGQGFESLTARHKKTRLHESVTLFFLYGSIIKENTCRGIRTRRHRKQSGGLFCRRGNEGSEAIGTGVPDKIPYSAP